MTPWQELLIIWGGASAALGYVLSRAMSDHGRKRRIERRLLNLTR